MMITRVPETIGEVKCLVEICRKRKTKAESQKVVAGYKVEAAFNRNEEVIKKIAIDCPIARLHVVCYFDINDAF